VNAARAPRRVSLHQRLLVITVASAAAVLLGVALLMFASGRMRADLNRATKAVLEEQ
jgi:uncharacterized protein involved in exopolysaccharide biosynthesis